MQFTVILSPEDGGYSVFCPACGNVASAGDDREDALRMITEAVGIWLEAGQSPAVESPAVVADGIREVLEFRLEAGLDFFVELASVTVPLAIAA